MLLGLIDAEEVVGPASDGEEALTLAAELEPDIVLMGLRSGQDDGQAFTASTTSRGWALNVENIELTLRARERQFPASRW
ncbi:MAG: hypothetical protein WCF24_06160 [Acidimicrobiales bacterium]